ncbi:MAG: hydroxymethylglutaryl-CoA reductase, degradative [Bacteroidota bacterium]
MKALIEGFSKLDKTEKMAWLAENYTTNPENTIALLQKYWNSDPATQKVHDEFIENTLSNYYLPFAIAPNFTINGKNYAIPMAIEESSVVAAASKAAKFWGSRGGFKAEIVGTEKVGQVHFIFHGETAKLERFFEDIHSKLLESVSDITRSMEKRGGGVRSISLRDKTQEIPGYFQLQCTFETKDAMGANFINSCLEQFAKTLQALAESYPDFSETEGNIEVVMSILSNYVPNCLVKASVSCPVTELHEDSDKANAFAQKMMQAIAIAKAEPYRAVTHNKGVMNGVDAVVLATGNDFRAVEAGVHAYATKDGNYSSLTHASIEDGIFHFWIELPLALGTVGGLTSLHPMVKLALEILQQPTAEELMQIVAVAGLAQNFAALNSLVTTGIQKGHMKMHLLNIINQLGANDEEKNQLVTHFEQHTVSVSGVKAALDNLRKS